MLRKKIMKIHLSFLLIFAVIFSESSSFSHPGRTDSNGGHYNRSTSVYHCHKATCTDLNVDHIGNNIGITRYNRKDWRHWIDEDEDCQNTRAEVLISQSQVKVEFATSRDCRVIKGSWIDQLTGALLSDASDVDIDHIIPLSYAHRHGGSSWSASKKEQFANDPINLLPTYDIENRKKSDKGPSEYLPSDKNLACTYIKRWQAIRNKYDLNIAPDDKVIIRDTISSTSTEHSC